MNGVDMADQLGVYYTFQRKTLKWWRKVFFWLLEVTVVNSYILYKEAVTSPKPHLTFRRSLVEALATRWMTAAPPRPRPGRPRKRRHPEEGDPQRLNGHLHLLDKLQKPRDCVVCSKQGSGARYRTSYFCKSCEDHPTLHLHPCFERYYTIIDYKL